MIAAPILEYMFITVTCCEEIAKKLTERFLQLFGVCVRIIASQTPGLSRSWKFYRHNSRTLHEAWKRRRASSWQGRASGRMALSSVHLQATRRNVELTVIGRVARRDAG